MRKLNGCHAVAKLHFSASILTQVMAPKSIVPMACKCTLDCFADIIAIISYNFSHYTVDEG